MTKKINEPSITEEEKDLFRSALKNVKPIHSDKRHIKKPIKRLISTKPITTPPTPPPLYFSNYSKDENWVAPEQTLAFFRAGLSLKQIKKLKQGKIPISASLDLHGLDVEHANLVLSEFLHSAYQQNKRCVRIIHGKGHDEKPILKNKINQWLKQWDKVLAFCTAIPRHGGAGAVYVLLRSK